MKPLFSMILSAMIVTLAAAQPAVDRPYAAQPKDSSADSLTRRATLTEARYLKSIYKTDAAIERLSKLVAPGAFDEEVLAELADCHFQNGDYETAAGTYQMLTLRSPENLLYRIKQMQLAYRMKDNLTCAAIGRDVLARDSIPAVAALASDAYNLAGLADSALLCYRQALALKPRNEAVVSKAANLLLAAKDYEGVLQLTADYLALDPDNFAIAPIQGLAYYLSAQYDSSLVVFQTLEDLGADSYPVHYYLGQSLWHTNVPYAADRELQQAWAIDSTDASLAVSIATVKSEYYRPLKEVRPWLDRAMQMLQPDSSLVSRIHQQYGLTYYRLNQFDLAIPHYQEAYRFNPSFIAAISTIAYCYEQQKQYKKALEYYERYLKLVKPGTKGYEFAKKSIEFLKGELFMEN